MYLAIVVLAVSTIIFGWIGFGSERPNGAAQVFFLMCALGTAIAVLLAVRARPRRVGPDEHGVARPDPTPAGVRRQGRRSQR